MAAEVAIAVAPEPFKAEPLISGRWVIYKDLANKDDMTVGLYAYNLDNQERIEIGRVERPTPQYLRSLYAVDAPWVVWSEGYASDKPELHLFNLDTRQTFTVAVSACSLDDSTGRPERPAISGEYVLFRGCPQALGYDIGSGEFFSVPISQVPAEPAAFVDWAFADGKLVWVAVLDPRGQGQTEVWTAPIELDSPPPTPDPVPTAVPPVTPASTASEGESSAAPTMVPTSLPVFAP